MNLHVLHVVGTRPNFMKVAPVIAALRERSIHQTLVHTGQHYDVRLSETIFKELDLPDPDFNLGVGSLSHARQTAEILVGMERVLLKRRPNLVLVYGDVNSTVAAALASVKLGVKVGHVESGLRSGDRTMPEEINRILTDRLATLLFVPSSDAAHHLATEGVPAEWIHSVGNVMIDTLIRLLPLTNSEHMLRRFSLMNGVGPRPFALVTLHRPSNVDADDRLEAFLNALSDLARDVPVIFPMHPRTRSRVNATGISCNGVDATEPLTYLQFLALQQHAALVITDSGGVQEETTYLGVPCLTVRENTERPITTTLGTNRLIGTDPSRLKYEARRILAGDTKKGSIPPMWDGNSASRIAAVIAHI